MTQARMLKLLSYVQKVNDQFDGYIQATFTCEFKRESLKLWFYDKQSGGEENRYYIYHTELGVTDTVNGSIYTIFDANLVKAEKHIRRVILEGNTDERETVSG